MGKRVNKRELSEIIGKSERTLTEWQAAGMPMVVNAGRGSSNEYDTSDVIQWMLDRAAAGSSTESAKDRLSRLQGDLVELQLSEKAGHLVPADGIEKTWLGFVLASKSILLSMADRLKVEIDTSYGTDIDLELVTTHVHTALGKLAGYQPADADLDDQQGSEAVCAATEDGDDPVGG